MTKLVMFTVNYNIIIIKAVNMHRVNVTRLYTVSCAFNSNILYLPDISREDMAEFFQVGDVEQGNLLIYQSAEV